jgi:Cu-Zn family superoxide dismutase
MKNLLVLVVDADGTATKPILAPELKSLKNLVGRGLIIHENSDN